eukprot:CAMPEP_0118973250 /NCGR_PEP_ID=MMETSP1173-20130426/9532_1 /TAXON_ID=1034831 /ORGANISM="Rhizochromulina marina cf, Strain CCMP1243" /LENGTH=101 /DNA_ID=CAMNT_0006922869 /DNA_START=56 /DNA_END=361 /DNA_ORIENTATION=+
MKFVSCLLLLAVMVVGSDALARGWPFNKGGNAAKEVAAKEPAKATKSKQRPFKLGGPTPGPELYDDGLSPLERDYIKDGKSAALTGAAKIRYNFSKGNKKF